MADMRLVLLTNDRRIRLNDGPLMERSWAMIVIAKRQIAGPQGVVGFIIKERYQCGAGKVNGKKRK